MQQDKGDDDGPPAPWMCCDIQHYTTPATWADVCAGTGLRRLAVEAGIPPASLGTVPLKHIVAAILSKIALLLPRPPSTPETTTTCPPPLRRVCTRQAPHCCPTNLPGNAPDTSILRWYTCLAWMTSPVRVIQPTDAAELLGKMARHSLIEALTDLHRAGLLDKTEYADCVSMAVCNEP